MTDGVRHYVSDCLQQRHPYDARSAFAGRPQRDAGLVFSGRPPIAIDDWIAALSDTVVGDVQRGRALRLLIAHTASQEEKITLLRKDIVTRLVALLNTKPSPDVECQTFALMRSLCVIPQGCQCVMDAGGLEAAMRSAQDTSMGEERLDARVMAVRVIYQISFNAAGVRWLLGVEVPHGFELLDAVSTTSCVAPVTKEAVIATLVFILQHDAKFDGSGMNSSTTTIGSNSDVSNKTSGGSPVLQMILYAVTALAQLTAVTEGIFAAMNGNAVTEVAALIHKYASNTIWLIDREIVGIVTQLIIIIWNVSLEQSGAELVGELGVPDDLFSLIAILYRQSISSNGPLLRALTGALSAVYKLLSVKQKSLDPLVGELSRIQVLYEFLRSINDVVSTAKVSQNEPHPDVVAISKNVVLCTRFAMELKSVRDFTRKFLEEMGKNGTNEAFYFRRQLFYSTKWEKEFDASV
ncbi:uncharacterized protein TM35_000012990 [Trypanosoma theileri]|uniref:Uncharacterized protein n=1 Tax=Trypanosoma theileri TaxID=67003 RepID=A0A1X0P918_9TRYP|nr:uncharacterized protein TM35_000012990 [Trypanosoma theileri]ORC93422.1 hypothetical protein TM35_000012990 [Trypanosoma theileri]